MSSRSADYSTASLASHEKSNARYSEIVGDLDIFFHDELVQLAGLYRRLGGRRLLDLGCGVGAQAVAAARLGYDVVGLDWSRSALTQTCWWAREAGVIVRPVLADMRRMPFAVRPTFDVIQCLGNALLLLPSRAAAIDALRQMAVMLVPGGHLLTGCREYVPGIHSPRRWVESTDDGDVVLLHVSPETSTNTGGTGDPHVFHVLSLAGGWLAFSLRDVGMARVGRTVTPTGFDYEFWQRL